MTIKRILLSLLLLITSISSYAFPDKAEDKLELLNLLRSHNYKSLTTRLESIQAKYESGELSERYVEHAFSAFSNSDPLHEILIMRWKKKFPASFTSYLASARYQSSLGWHSRGTRFISKTSKQQVSAMRKHFDTAISDYFEALKRNKNLIPAYTGLLSIGNGLGQDKFYNEIFSASIERFPHSYLIRDQHLFHLLPKWGGSIKQIRAFLIDTRSLEKHNPDLKLLRGYSELALGDDIAIGRKEKRSCKNAQTHFDTAVRKSDKAYFLYRRAKNYRCLKHYKLAINDFKKALKLLPQKPGYLEDIGYAYYRLKDYNNALIYLDQAVALDKMDPSILRSRGRVHYRLHNAEKALTDFKDSLRYGSHNSTAYSYMGYINYNMKKDFSQATSNFKKAVEIDPENGSDWYMLASSQYQIRSCNFIHSGKSYIRECRKNNKCSDKRVNWIKKSSEHSITRGICPQ